MVSIQRISLLTGMVSVVAIAATLPAAAAVMTEQVETQTATFTAPTESDQLMAQVMLPEKATVATSETPLTAEIDAVATIAPVAAEVNLAEVEIIETAPVLADATDESVSTSAATLLSASEAEIALTNSAQPTAEPTDNAQIAQVTRPLYRGVAPFYLGIGGNIGVGDDDASAVGDFAFAVISKVSLGPRFAVRPSLLVSEEDVSLAVPLTYNINPIQAQNFTLAPFVGAGVDIAFDGDAALLLNGGVDIPLSRQFTFNSQANFRVTDDFSAGIILGVAYNVPVFFE
ncbi:MAG: hypothetical protein ACTS3T_21440 [Almyronema sp.]